MLDKNQAMREMDVMLKRPFIYVCRSVMKAAGMRIMLPAALHPTNRSEVIAWDLSQEPR